MNRLFLIASLSLASNFSFGQLSPNYEQIVVDYFFEEIFKDEFGNVKTLGFSGETDSVRPLYSLGIMLKCEQWSREEKEKFIDDFPVEVKKIDLVEHGYRIRNNKPRMNKLVIHILPAFQIESKAYTLVTLYKKLEFIEYFLFEADLSGEITTFCRQGQVI